MSSREQPASSLRERRKARTRATIQSRALDLFRKQGYQATTIDQIIHAAEVSETTFFRYFPTKEDLVLQDDLDPLIVAAVTAQPPDTPPLDAIRTAVRAAFDSLTAAQRQEFRARVSLIMVEPPLRAAMLDQLSRAIQLLADPIAARAGLPRDDLAVRTIAGAAIGAMLAAMSAMADDPTADLADTIDQALAHLATGLHLPAPDHV